MGTRAVISREQFCADGMYFPISGPSGDPRYIEKALVRATGETLEAVARRSSCRREFCTGEHAAEVFHARPWGMHPDYNYYLGADGKVRASYMLKGSSRREFGEDHTLNGWIFTILPKAQRELEQKADDARQAKAQARADRRLEYETALKGAALTEDDIAEYARAQGWTDFQIRNGIPHATRMEMLAALTIHA